MRDRKTDFDAKLITLARLALAEAFDLGRMQGVELVFVLALLRANALGALQYRVQLRPRQCAVRDRRFELAFDFTNDDAQYGALAFEGAF